MMTHDEIIAVLQAHKEGKPIEWSARINIWEPSRASLKSILDHIANDKVSYRIAPEPPKPEYVPFESMEEFMPYRDKWMRIKSNKNIFRVTNMTHSGIYHMSESFCWKSAFCMLEFEDGTPCGKKVEK